MTKKEFLANVKYLEDNQVFVEDSPCWDNLKYSRELYFSTDRGGDFSICVEELTRYAVLEYLDSYDISDATSMWWEADNTPFPNIGELYEDIKKWRDDFIEIAYGMPY